MIGTLTNFNQLGTAGPMNYIGATYKDDNGIQQTGISLTEIGHVLESEACKFTVLDANYQPHTVEGTASCIVTGIAPDKDANGSQLETGSLAYRDLVINYANIPNPANPPVVFINPMNTWGWALPFAGGG